MKKVINNIISIFAIVLILFLPFQAPLQAFLEKYLPSGATFWIGHWYEPIIIILFAISIAMSLRRACRQAGAKRGNLGDCFGNSRLAMTNWVAIALLALGIISSIFISPSISRGLEGFRFTLFALLAFIIAKQAKAWSTREESTIYREKLQAKACSTKPDYQFPKKLKSPALPAGRYYLITAAVVAFLAIVERFLPLGYWSNILGSTFGWGNFSIVKYYQSSSVLPGPNQLASYLIPALFIVINNAGKLKVKSEKLKVSGLLFISRREIPLWGAVYYLLLTSAIFFSFSRSAWVAVTVTLIITFVVTLVRKNEYSNWIKYILGASSIIIIIFGIYLSTAGTVSKSDVITHGQSQSQHIYAIKDSFSEIVDRKSQPIKLIFGSGLGTAGPAVLKYGDGFVSESWYLQLALELGIVGLVLWLTLVATLIIRLWREHQTGIMLGLIGVSIAAIFLHTWADNPALAITLLILVGVAVNKENDTHRINT